MDLVETARQRCYSEENDDACQKPLNPAPHELLRSLTVTRERWDIPIQRAQAPSQRGRDY